MQAGSVDRLAPLALEGPRPTRWLREAAHQARQRPFGAFCALLIVALIITAVFAPAIAPYSYKVRAGLQLKGPSTAHFFGTDSFSRDEFSRIVYGARSTVEVGLGAAALGTLVALTVGVISGFVGGVLDIVTQRIVDTLMSLPWLVMVLSVMAFVGSGTTTVILVLGLLMAPGMSRIMRGATLSIREAAYVDAARATGAGAWRLILRHTLPNVFAPAMIIGTLAVGNAILAEAALSFLGFGLTPPIPSWGEMLSSSGRQFMEYAPWLAIFPGLAISITVFAFNMFGDVLRDILDPRLRNT